MSVAGSQTIRPDGPVPRTAIVLGPFTHGGRRKNAGRKLPAGKRPPVKHRTRPQHAWTYPAHVTIPFLQRVGSLRRQLVFKKLREIFHQPNIDGFQVVHYSVQNDHIHLIVEAMNRRAFSSGMRSVGIRAARGINRLFATKGKVLRDRYHRRDLFTAKQVRDVLVYVLLNGAKHRVVWFGALDTFSSSASFDGWRDTELLTTTRWIPHATGDPPPAPRSPWTRLLIGDWKSYGLISVDESIRWVPPIEWDP